MFTGRQILKNTLLLTAAALLLRLLSMLFQAYLAGRIGADGLGGVQLVLSVSAFAATLGLAGARVAASCLCAEAYGRRDSAGLQGAAAHCLGYVLLTSTLAAAGLFLPRRGSRGTRCACRRRRAACGCWRGSCRSGASIWCWADI
ncbi:MAG: MATE family efflux transporter [Oscillospiraceae bacterium]